MYYWRIPLRCYGRASAIAKLPILDKYQVIVPHIPAKMDGFIKNNAVKMQLSTRHFAWLGSAMYT
jgi:hypothetical protein